jgi:hypothetical protein
MTNYYDNHHVDPVDTTVDFKKAVDDDDDSTIDESDDASYHGKHFHEDSLVLLGITPTSKLIEFQFAIEDTVVLTPAENTDHYI